VVKTRVGFSEGAEVVQVEFDPTVVAYQELLQLFWSAHDPTDSNRSRLYQKAIFYHTQAQKTAALQSLQNKADQSGSPITTTIESVRFKRARDSEQKYYLRHSPLLWREFQKHYPKDSEIVDSPAAAKVNGYLGGYSNQEQFRAHAPGLGLSASALAELSKRVPREARHYLPVCSKR